MMKKGIKIIRISTNLLKLDGIRIRYPYPVSASGIRYPHFLPYAYLSYDSEQTNKR